MYFFECFFLLSGMPFSFLMLVVGLAVLLKGADFLVKGASSIAKRFHVSDIFIGITVVSLGTSAPELLVNIMSSIKGYPDFAFGNVLGSNNFNTLLVLGIAGIFYPMTIERNVVRYKMPILILIMLVFWVLVSDDFWGMSINKLSRVDSAILLTIFVAFMYYVYSTRKQSKTDVDVSTLKQYKKKPYLAIGAVVLGLGMLFGGGELAVENAIIIARNYDISERIIGLTILAIGTSLPELATSLVAIHKKNTGIAIGNVIGSNIFNVCMVLGLTGLITPIPYNNKLNFDLYVAIASTLLFFSFMFTFKKDKLDRGEAVVLLVGYLLYIAFLIYSEVGL